jgi:excisionase family DNA binding protein
MKKWMSVSEIAEYLGLHENTIYRYLSRKKNKIPSYRVGKLYKFDPIEVDEWIKKGNVK